MKMPVALLITLALSLPLCAHAQENGTTADPTTGAIATPQEEPLTAAPYDDKLLRLSEVLGSIHYLRALCGAQEGGKWRNWMADILKSEEPIPSRRAQLVSRFNRGFRAFDQTYTACTSSALLAADRYLKEGVRLSSQITNRYGR
ncbi:TIGR02301 family protein [Pseudahrensia aquimaris]|uniref:TIGR02301 family protein n=1 Tax=Pseudahrensia aquimaris TaxID=744461 RepID=A0ABW3FEP3_9HYPH